MVQKIIILLITMIALISMVSSCGIGYRNSLDESLHNQIEYLSGEGGPYAIIYQSEKYLLAESFIGDVYEDDILLGWNGNRYFGYINAFYSDTTDSPIFIYNSRLGNAYLHEDYNYKDDTFIIGNTDKEIAFEDVFHTKCNYAPDFLNYYGTKIELSSKQYPRIKTYVKVVHVDDQWYMWIKEKYSEVYIPSDDFIKIISESIFPEE